MSLFLSCLGHLFLFLAFEAFFLRLSLSISLSHSLLLLNFVPSNNQRRTQNKRITFERNRKRTRKRVKGTAKKYSKGTRRTLKVTHFQLQLSQNDLLKETKEGCLVYNDIAICLELLTRCGTARPCSTYKTKFRTV